MLHRDPRQRDPDYMGWVAKLPCVGCLARGRGYQRPVQVAHIRSAYEEEGWRHVGKAEKPHDWRTAPLCVRCHLDGPEAQHRGNEAEWWASLGIYPPDLCKALREAYAAGRDGVAVVASFAAAAARARLT